MISTVLTAIPVILGGLLIVSALWEFMTWRSRFANWTHGVAKSLGAAKKQGDVGPHLAYEYVIDGATYEGRSTYMKNALPGKGEGVHIYYDPANPHHSEWYDGGLHKTLMIGTGLIGALIVWMAL